jgi:hypothetical protein
MDCAHCSRGLYVCSTIQIGTQEHRRAQSRSVGGRASAADTSGAWVATESGSDAGQLPPLQARPVYDGHPMASARIRVAVTH